MAKSWEPDPDRLFPADEKGRTLARELYEPIAGLPIVSPHGHCDPAWFATDAPFPDPAELLIKPDHHILRMLYSRGILLADFGIPARDGITGEANPRAVWQRFSHNWHLFLGTPTRLWLEHVFVHVFGIEEPLSGMRRKDAARLARWLAADAAVAAYRLD